ncbi:MATH and LRR domain-containing protein PFE0570w-like isoform X2 [Adelges cooleyi]|uniref:MATH and LRR domain-containing protein PFE0570w-like isoform X2 n=1 Tax=Adelges cooleyi TaxID=133065 RepID=UPI0021801834|nr:MATH and LRR domain-containing protein PFE0570w-like isoform X2 [Adelges cooleyi]
MEPGWLRLGDLAIGNGGVCVTSLIKDKIREYMLNEEQQTSTVAATPTTATLTTMKKSNGDTCVRRIGNSLDLLMSESRNASHAVAVIKNKIGASSQAKTTEEHIVSTTMKLDADSSNKKTPKKYNFVVLEDEMQISRMPIPTDECASSEMSVDVVNHSDSSKSESVNKLSTNGDEHKQLNGNSVENLKEITIELSDSTENVEEELEGKNQSDNSSLNINNDKPNNNKPNDESISVKETDKNNLETNILDENESEKNNSETNKLNESILDDDKSDKKNQTIDKLEEKITTEDKLKESINKGSITDIDNIVEKTTSVVQKDDGNVESLEVDQDEHHSEDCSISRNMDIKKEQESENEITETENAQNSEKLTNGESSLTEDRVKLSDVETSQPNGETLLSDEDKSIKLEVVKAPPEDEEKSTMEEDICSEVSMETLSPKQNEEPVVVRKRSAASHDELSAVSGASSDNDLPKTKKLRCDDDVSLLKDDTRERLIKNIVQSSGKSEVELTRNIEKIQNEIKVITEIAQNKRDELVTLIRLQKLKEEIIERLMIKVKEIDAAKTDNSKDWNLPEMFQINLSQPEHMLSEKCITDIIDGRDPQLEKLVSTSYDHNSSITTAIPTISSVALMSPSSSQSNDWTLADRLSRINRIQRPILPKPTTNNQKEGRQGPILDVKLIIADHRSKNPETVVPKRGRRKVPNDFSVPTSSSPLRYPSPLSYPNSIHIPNDVNFKPLASNIHGIPNNIMEQHTPDINRFKDVPAFPEVTLHPVSQPMQQFQQQQQLQQQQQQHQQQLQLQQQQQNTSLLHGILTKGTGNHHLPVSLPSHPTTYSPTLARLLTAPERCKQMRGKRQIPTATVVSSNAQTRNEITITPVQSTSMSSTFHQKSNVTSNIQPTPVDDEDASDRLVIDEGQDSMNVGSPSNAPQCQGCMQKPAQFVCAGCGNQWYCSKDCQIDAWDDHSEVCSG